MVKPEGLDGPEGPPGRAGDPGLDGTPGTAGKDGVGGKDAKAGKVWFRVVRVGDAISADKAVPRESGVRLKRQLDIAEEAATRYDLQIDSLEVADSCGDNIFEPGEWVTIHGIQLTNFGGLTLPAGAIISFPFTKTMHSEQQKVVLPALGPGTHRVGPLTHSLTH